MTNSVDPDQQSDLGQPWLLLPICPNIKNFYGIYDVCFQALDLDSITTHHWLIQDCSAVTGENLLKGIDWVIDDIASRIFTMD